jgi:hypothetical protein
MIAACVTVTAPELHQLATKTAGTPSGPATPITGSMRLAGAHFAAAMLYLVAGAAGLVWIAPELANGLYASPHVAGVTHLFTLGWLTTTIFGALYQILPGAFAAPLRSVTLGHVSFCAFAPGAGLFACAVADRSTTLEHVGAGLVGVGVLLTVANIGSSLSRSRSRDVTWGAVCLALGFLTSTLGLGVVLLYNLDTGVLAEVHARVLAIHVHVAIVGWVLVMIVGVSHRMLPMFLVARGADTRWTKRALVSLGAGVVALSIGLAISRAALAWVGVAALETGVGCFLWQAFSFYRVRVKTQLDVGLQFAATALAFLATAAVLGPFVFVLGATHAQLATAYALVGLLGGIVMYVSGFFYKIVPMLAWTVRHRGRVGTTPVPTVAESFSARVARVQLAAMASGVVLLGGGIGAASSIATRAGAMLFAGGVVLFAAQIARLASGLRRT